MTSPAVTVITPTKDRAHFARCLYGCVAQQDFDDLEWLIADNSAEPDAFLSTLSDHRVRYIHLAAPLSIGAKRNLLADQARGEIIVHFDDDDYYSPGYVSRAVTDLKRNSADMVKLSAFHLYSAIYDKFGYWDLTRKVGRHFVWSKAAITELAVDDTTNGWLANMHLGYGFSYAFAKAAWRSIPFPDINFGEDGTFALAVSQRFRMVIRPDTHADCLHILHLGNTSKCFPQSELPRWSLELMFPGVRSHLRMFRGSGR